MTVLRGSLIAMVVIVAGCASDAPATHVSASERHGVCAARMYAARAGRSAPNWNLYDYCMKAERRE